MTSAQPPVSRGWLPYALVGGLAVVSIVVLLLSATGPNTGTGAPSGYAGAPAATDVEPVSPAAPVAPEPIDVAIRLSPSGDIAYGEDVTIEVAVSNQQAVSIVLVSVDGVPLAPADENPFEFIYTPPDTGSYAVTAEVVDVDGESWEAPKETFEVAEDSRSDIQAVIDRWVESIMTQNLNAHMDCYGAVVDPYFKASKTNAEVRSNKSTFFNNAYDEILHEVWDVNIAPSGPDYAVVTLQKRSRFVSDTVFSVHVQQQLDFRREGGEWKIVGERDTQVY